MAHHVAERVVGQVERVTDHVLIGREDAIGIGTVVVGVVARPKVVCDAEDFAAQLLGARARMRVEPAPDAQFKQRGARDLARAQHGGDGVGGELLLRLRGVFQTEDALGERLIEEREGLGAGGVGNAAQRRARDEVGRTELLEVVTELVHGGVEAVPAEFGIEA